MHAHESPAHFNFAVHDAFVAALIGRRSTHRTPFAGYKAVQNEICPSKNQSYETVSREVRGNERAERQRDCGPENAEHLLTLTLSLIITVVTSSPSYLSQTSWESSILLITSPTIHTGETISNEFVEMRKRRKKRLLSRKAG